ncbi:vacuolar sorting protein 39 domain 1-domain-containing protein [Collybia nuda]|uniref:Vacuolar sorting protein 39 domain 1-domain-containing protein n=1 Tax=Collybia nuda TaxID=64659 RepID=A0A9P5YGE4_9AGAR|nr:vacuolar sorting protein 39 domain 1-domain-containing protein [Collybia nuda]
MAPFLSPNVLISGFKEKIDALVVQGDRLYIGTSIGNLHIYSIDNSAEDGEDSIKLVEVKKGLTRRPIEQLGFIKDINSLVVLSEATVTLYPLPVLSPPTPLVKAKAAFSFAVHTSIQQIAPETRPEYSLGADPPKAKTIPTLVTQLLVGCRRKVVIYSWKDGEAQDVKECALPHSARSISFLNEDAVCFAYSPTDYSMFSTSTMTATEISTPLPITTSATAMGALSGLTGYMTLGLGAKAKPAVVRISDSEVLIAKDNEGTFVGTDGKLSRPASIEWPALPEELAFVKPYIFAILPPGSVPSPPMAINSSSTTIATQPQPSFISTTVIQIRSSLASSAVQTIPFPFNPSTSTAILPTGAAPSNATIRLLTSSPTAKSPLLLVTTPSDRNTAAAEGSTIWQIDMKPWTEQIDELVKDGQYADALALLDTVDEAVLSDKDARQMRIRALNAVSEFCHSEFDSAIDTFIELDLNPAKVVALYPDSVAGRLSVSHEKWIPLYGGPDSLTVESPWNTNDVLHRSVETLVRYLSDRRPKLGAALEAVHITPQHQSHEIAPLSETSIEELFALPNAPLPALTPEQLLRFAQIVDTALYKAYLIIRPGLLGSLCRVPNWCEVSEVEEDLRSRQKYAELRDLYNGKKMHAQALSLLKELSQHESDIEDKILPSIQYLQKLGPEHLQQIFNASRWIFDTDADMAFDIFTSEDVELPREDVANYLEEINPKICARYLEYLIEDRHEDLPSFHDRLAELYLSMTLTAKKRNDEGTLKDTYSKLLQFIDTNQVYHVDRLYGHLSSTDLFEARAILLGRLSRHDQALELYVYRMHDYLKAEEYCKRVYQPDTETKAVFLTLLRIYLRPTVNVTADLLRPALDLISRHNPRLDSVEALQLLPPLVTAQDIRGFLIEALRAPIFDTAVIRQISKARNDHLAQKLMVLQSRRVKVTDSRICPQCHKRIGNSVISVHTPRGEVTHYQCRESFARQLNEVRQ